MITGRHFASNEIKRRVKELNTSWEGLEAASTSKRERLQQAYQVMFNHIRRLSVFSVWYILSSCRETCLETRKTKHNVEVQ